MIATDATIDTDRSQRTRERLNHFLAPEDIRAALISRGIDPLEAKARIDSLTDAEVERIADMMDQLPAGSGFFETFLIVVFLIFIILLFTDIYGYTDVFPFVNKKPSPKTTRDKTSVETVSKKGYSDSTGSASYDQMVSEIRANTVKNYLIAKGISPEKISTEGKGSQDVPAGTASEEKGRVVLEFN